MSKTKNLLKKGNICKEEYDKVSDLSGGIYESSSQSNKLRNLKTSLLTERRNETKDKTYRFRWAGSIDKISARK